ncbi:MAG: hypothetical protein RJA36_2421 [Pseudomonadota bacterium]
MHLTTIGRKLFAADDAARHHVSDRRLRPERAAELARMIIAEHEARALAAMPGADLWEPEAAVLRAQAVLLDRMALDHPEHGAALSEAAGELRNAAATVRLVVASIREQNAAEAA